METPSAKKLVASSAATQAAVPRMSVKERVFVRLLRGLKGGALQLIFPSGASVRVGAANDDAPAQLSIVDTRFFKLVLSGGSVGFGEAYVAGYWTTDDLTGLLHLMAQNQQEVGRLRQGFSWFAQRVNQLYHRARRNTLEQSRENIQQHYDLSNDFYATFLDSSMTYSSAYYGGRKLSLEEAQWAKVDRMLDLAEVGAGDSILEIGSGWGALAERAALRGCQVKTITLSQQQLLYAQSRFERAGLNQQIEIALEDYRHVAGEFDAVISCEMIEAVGREYLESYFQVIQQRLKSGGKAVVQAITIPDARYEAYSRGCDWIQKHIFPGGHLPSPAAIKGCVTAAGAMRVVQIDGFAQDYATTLNEWAQRFKQQHAAITKLGFDAEFCRKWNYYLSYCQAGFLTELIDVKHVVLQRD